MRNTFVGALAPIRFRAIHPGGAGVQFVRNALQLLGRRSDVVAVDTRGVGASRPALDCDADPERLGVYPRALRTYARRCAERSGT